MCLVIACCRGENAVGANEVAEVKKRITREDEIMNFIIEV